MKIVVCVKQVFDTSQLKFDENTGEMKPGAEQVLNPYCEYAIETALRIKESQPEGSVEIIAVSMGLAKEALKRALAMGANSAIMLNDPSFEGADSLSTALVLASAIEKLIPDANLVLTGQTAAEAATGATGLQVAALLDWPVISQAKAATLTGDNLEVVRETEAGIEKYQTAFPAVVCTQKCDYEPRMPNIKGVMMANRAEIPEHNLASLGLDASQVGLSGSASTVTKTFARPKREAGQKLTGQTPQEAAQAIVNFLQSRQLV